MGRISFPHLRTKGKHSGNHFILSNRSGASHSNHNFQGLCLFLPKLFWRVYLHNHQTQITATQCHSAFPSRAAQKRWRTDWMSRPPLEHPDPWIEESPGVCVAVPRPGGMLGGVRPACPLAVLSIFQKMKIMMLISSFFLFQRSTATSAPSSFRTINGPVYRQGDWNLDVYSGVFTNSEASEYGRNTRPLVC